MKNIQTNIDISFKSSKNLENIGIQLSDFEEIPDLKRNRKYTILGKGNFGYTEKMKSKINNKYYAIKKLEESNIKEKDFLRETGISIDLNHENITKFYGFFKDIEKIEKYSQIFKGNAKKTKKEDKTIFCLVLEYISNGSLNDYMIKYKLNFKNKNDFKPISQEFIIKIFKQMLEVLKYLHNKKIMHRDFKPDNILLDENYNIKVSDFGLSVIYNEQINENHSSDNALEGGNTVVGRLDFIAPEVQNKQKYDYGADMYSLGLTMLFLMSYNNPIKFYIDITDNQKKRVIDKNSINQQYDKYLRELVLLLVNEDKDMRKNAFEAYKDLIEIEKKINQKNNNNQQINQKNNPYQKNKSNEKQSINNNQQINKNNLPYQTQQSDEIKNNNNKKIYSKNSDIQIISKSQPPLTKHITVETTNITKNNLDNYNQNNITIPLQYYSNKNCQYIINNPNFPKNPIIKNTSLIRVIQCFRHCIDKDIKNKIKMDKESFFYKLINLIEASGYIISKEVDREHFNKSLNELKEKIATKYKDYINKDEISPKTIISDLFIIINNESIKNNIQWENNIFNGLIEPNLLRKNNFPKIYEKIEYFKKCLKNPFVCDFHFISLQLIQCSKCKYILKASPHIQFYIILPSNIKDYITNLLKAYEHSSKNMTEECPYCKNKYFLSNEFFSSPKYLLIQFNGEKKEGKIMEEEIYLDPYILSNIGPRKYNLLAFIIKEENNQSKAVIKNEKENNWDIFSDFDSVGKFNYVPTHYYFPNLAIYKGC